MSQFLLPITGKDIHLPDIPHNFVTNVQDSVDESLFDGDCTLICTLRFFVVVVQDLILGKEEESGGCHKSCRFEL